MCKSDTAPPQAQAKQTLSKIEKQGGDNRANANIPPGDLHNWQHLEDHGLTQKLQSNVGERVDHGSGNPAGTRVPRACTKEKSQSYSYP